MARVTVEDCTKLVPNRFNLVLAASARARQLFSGAEPTLERDRDKNSVIALREIAAETIDPDQMLETIIQNMQKVILPEEEELSDEIPVIAATPSANTGDAINTEAPAEPISTEPVSNENTVNEDSADGVMMADPQPPVSEEAPE